MSVSSSGGTDGTAAATRGAGVWRCFSITSVTCPPRNGGQPASIAYITRPRA